jgi:hypothetical protein
MAISRIAPLTSSTPLSSINHLNCARTLMSSPFFFFSRSSTLPRVLFSSKHYFSWWAEPASARAVIRYSPISIPNLLPSSFPRNTSLSLGRADLSSRGLAVFYRPPLLSTSLATPPKLS